MKSKRPLCLSSYTSGCRRLATTTVRGRFGGKMKVCEDCARQIRRLYCQKCGDPYPCTKCGWAAIPLKREETKS